MNSDQTKFCDKHLRGRSAAETKQLQPLIKAIDSATRTADRLVRGPAPRTERGLASRLERRIEAEKAIDAAYERLREKLEALGEARRQRLPNTADRIVSLGRDADDHSTGRYKVVCITTDGETFDLGGCISLGDAQDREAWFKRELKRRDPRR